MSDHLIHNTTDMPTWRVPGLRWRDDLSDIADTLGFREDRSDWIRALAALIDDLHAHVALTPEITAVLSSCSWTAEETRASRILEAYYLPGELFSQTAIIRSPYQAVPESLVECVQSLAITISCFGTRRFNTKPVAWMWFPTTENHVTALAYVLMLYIYLVQHLPQERDPARKERMIKTYHNALDFLQIFRCLACGANLKEDAYSRPVLNTDTRGFSRMCHACGDLEEGEIIEIPSIMRVCHDGALSYSICTHDSGDPECRHFLHNGYLEEFVDANVDLSMYY